MSEVSKAAERLRDEFDERRSAADRLIDLRTVAEWALPLLDETPVTKQWCDSIGFETRAIYQGNDWIPTVWGNQGWIEFPSGATRGQLRLLCLALGIELKGDEK